jgi:hypothetical protein
MLKSQTRLIRYLLPIALAAVYLFPTAVSAQDNQTVNYAPPSLSLTAESTKVSACPVAGGPQVKLNARASSPGGHPIAYRWSASQGRIVGDGPVVTWDLSGVAPGTHKAFVEIQTGPAGNYCEAFSSTNVLVMPCPPPRPVCPDVSIICPTDIVPDQPLTFSSNVSGGSPSVTPIYNWTVSAGTIIEGQGTPTIKVDTTGLAGQTVRATLSMGGYTLDCSASCAVQIPIPQPNCRKFDEFPDIARNDEKARLDNYAVELQNDPTATAYVIVYPGRASRSGDVQKHTTRIVDYLVNSRGIDARRIVTLVGTTREELMVELWTCPQGAPPPRP